MYKHTSQNKDETKRYIVYSSHYYTEESNCGLNENDTDHFIVYKYFL